MEETEEFEGLAVLVRGIVDDDVTGFHVVVAFEGFVGRAGFHVV